MSGRRRTRDNVGMNLFPFLAVLICTMGGLIILLVVMVQQARVRAIEGPAVNEVAQARVAQQTAEIEAINSQRLVEFQKSKVLAERQQAEIDDYKWQSSMLKQSYEQTVAALADQRLALSHLESHARELSEQASRMQAEADLIAKNTSQDKDFQNEKQSDLDDLKNQLASAQKEVDALRNEVANQSTKYSLVPYDGPNGTQRPPIYVECFANRVVLQPENVVLIGEDFQEPLTINNPLAAALRAKREFLMDQGLIQPGVEPYPLLVVRPGAASSYAAARTAMKAWESEFGYELVEEDIELDYQVADPRLSQLLNDIVIEARGSRRLMQSAQNIGRKRQTELLRPAVGGGFETVPNGSSSYAGGRSNGGFERRGSGQGFGGSENSFGDRGDGFGEGGSPNGDSTVSFSGSRGTENGMNGSASGNSNYEGDPFPSVGGTNGTSGTGADSAGNSEGPTGNSATGQSTTAGGGGTSESATGSGGQGASGNGGSSSVNQQSSSASASMSFDATQSLAQSRGGNWALPTMQDNAVGIRRPIKVVCDREKIVLVPERATPEEVQIFRHNGAVPGVIDPFVDAVQARLKSWGIAGHGIYWRPILQVQIQNEAYAPYRQLMQLLDKSGIEVTHEP